MSTLRKSLRERRRYVVFLKKGEFSFEDLARSFSRYFGELLLLKANLKLIKEDEKFIVVRCKRGFENKVILVSLFEKNIIPLKVCGSIKKTRRVIRKWSSTCSDTTEQ